MTDISDELRKVADEWDVTPLYALANRVDNEMVKLPKDADGVPIHVGDPVFVFRSGDALFVSGILMKAGCVCVRVNHAGKADDWYTTPGAITIKRPDSLERIADELVAWCDRVDVDGDACDVPRDIAERIRKLAAKEGGDACACRV